MTDWAPTKNLDHERDTVTRYHDAVNIKSRSSRIETMQDVMKGLNLNGFQFEN